MATSKLNPRLFGRIIRWINEDMFVVLINDDYEVLGHRKYWDITED